MRGELATRLRPHRQELHDPAIAELRPTHVAAYPERLQPGPEELADARRASRGERVRSGHSGQGFRRPAMASMALAMPTLATSPQNCGKVVVPRVLQADFGELGEICKGPKLRASCSGNTTFGHTLALVARLRR